METDSGYMSRNGANSSSIQFVIFGYRVKIFINCCLMITIEENQNHPAYSRQPSTIMDDVTSEELAS